MNLKVKLNSKPIDLIINLSYLFHYFLFEWFQHTQ